MNSLKEVPKVQLSTLKGAIANVLSKDEDIYTPHPSSKKDSTLSSPTLLTSSVIPTKEHALFNYYPHLLGLSSFTPTETFNTGSRVTIL